MLNSSVILAKGIRIDGANVLSYYTNAMLDLCRANQVYSNSTYSFVQETEELYVGASYQACIQANYIAYQNPNYSNKWFFAFIDDVIYVSDQTCQIRYTVDAWTTWFEEWTPGNCYILRQHTNNDTIGANTQPENLETGEYIADFVYSYETMNNMSYIIQVTEYTNESSSKPLATNFGGVYSAGGAYICDNINQVVNIIQAYQDGREDAILGVYMCPKYFINNTSGTLQYSGQDGPVYDSFYIQKPTHLNGYVPRNNKLLTFPYCYLNVSNNNGSINTYQYDLFHTDSCQFNIKGVPTIGASIKCYPYMYKVFNDNVNEDEGLMAGKFPTLSWSGDPYTNWLTQNGVNIGLGVASNVLTIAGGIASGNPVIAGGAVVSGTTGLINQANQVYQHSITPNTAKGNVNGGDINTSSNSNTFIFYCMNIRAEYARVIDDNLTIYGYAENRILRPNIVGRRLFNYLQIAPGETVGYGTVPKRFMDEINGMCQRGVWIWHDHTGVGNAFYTNNDIV